MPSRTITLFSASMAVSMPLTSAREREPPTSRWSSDVARALTRFERNSLDTALVNRLYSRLVGSTSTTSGSALAPPPAPAPAPPPPPAISSSSAAEALRRGERRPGDRDREERAERDLPVREPGDPPRPAPPAPPTASSVRPSGVASTGIVSSRSSSSVSERPRDDDRRERFAGEPPAGLRAERDGDAPERELPVADEDRERRLEPARAPRPSAPSSSSSSSSPSSPLPSPKARPFRLFSETSASW
mmetsp:Transcript_177620/g.432133  ORF Transcript_177620/g.432133 Transcript_177620/m.432133 type:complete len:246 (-) Transcript_177620:1733-2470(-)